MEHVQFHVWGEVQGFNVSEYFDREETAIRRAHKLRATNTTFVIHVERIVTRVETITVFGNEST